MSTIIRDVAGVLMLIAVLTFCSLGAVSIIQRFKSTPTEQILKCSTGVNKEPVIMAKGIIRKIDDRTFEVSVGSGPKQYIIKGDMDACAIANIQPEPELTVTPSTRNING